VVKQRAGSIAPMSGGPSRKRPLDAQASVWVVMRSVTVPTCEDWGEAPHLQVAMSGVFASKEAAEEASAKHQKALAEFCEQQSVALRDEVHRGQLQERFGSIFECPNSGTIGYYRSELKVVEMPILTESPTTEPKYKLGGKKMQVELEGAPNDGIFAGPIPGFDSYNTDVKPKHYCRMLKNDGDREDDEDEEDGEEDEDKEDGEEED
jgi:hypothetical protein